MPMQRVWPGPEPLRMELQEFRLTQAGCRGKHSIRLQWLLLETRRFRWSVFVLRLPAMSGIYALISPQGNPCRGVKVFFEHPLFTIPRGSMMF